MIGKSIEENLETEKVNVDNKGKNEGENKKEVEENKNGVHIVEKENEKKKVER